MLCCRRREKPVPCPLPGTQTQSFITGTGPVESCHPDSLIGIPPGEGQWPWQDLSRLDENALKQRGLEIPLSEFWTTDQGGLAQAVVGFPGCSGAFISEHGLLVTNHHCVYSAIQKASTPERNLLENGFLARTREQEVVAPGTAIRVFISQTDVTDRMMAGLKPDASDPETAQHLRTREYELVTGCEKDQDFRCSLSRENDGLRFWLLKNLEIRDIRLVYVPPESLGSFGGEIDNWQWPRHTLDFAILRAWVDEKQNPAPHSTKNVPFEPPRFLKISQTGPSFGDFIMVAGTPYRTSRYRTAQEIRALQEWFFPFRERLASSWSSLVEEMNRKYPEARIPNAPRMRSLGNRLTNARGQIEGINRNQVIARRLSEEQSLLEWIRRNNFPVPAQALHDLNLHLASVTHRNLDFLLEEMKTGVTAFANAYQIIKWAWEQGLPDEQRSPGYRERDKNNILERMKNSELSYHPPTDRAVLAMFLGFIKEIPDEEIPAFLRMDQREPETRRLEETLEHIYQGTGIMNAALRESLFNTSFKDLRQSTDPMIQFVWPWFHVLQEMEQRQLSHEGALFRLRRPLMQATAAYRGKSFYPDANASPRVSFATVTGYSPQDGVWNLPFTTLRGMLAKHRGADPFRLPAPFIEAAQQENHGRWTDQALEDVPICFLSNADTTGGNSGSPVLNGKGHFIGINFDRVYQNIAGDFGYNIHRSRNIMVDVRAILWTLDRFASARELLAELGVAMEH